MTNKTSILALIVALIALAIAVVHPATHDVTAPVKQESAFERITRTGTLRCGYYLMPSWVMKDPNTGAMSGAIVDYVNALGDALKLKIVWQEEINLGTYLQDLQDGRYDAECSGGWPNALRGKQVEYSTPIFYFPLYVIARADDHRFDNNYAALNDPAIRISGHDGATDAQVRIQRFPKATADDLPGNAPATDSYQNVVANKADATIDNYAVFSVFDKSNPGKIRKVDGAPVRVIPASLSFAAGEYRLQQMLNTATNEMIYDGVIDQIIDKYEPAPGAFLRVAPPYSNPVKQ